MRNFTAHNSSVCVKYLGCPAQSWQGEMEDDLLQSLKEDVFAGGNFGHKDLSRADEAKFITSRKEGGVNTGSNARQAILSAFWDASVFGVISPSIRSTTVSIPVAIPVAAFPKSFMVRVVTSDETPIFTILFPTRMVESILLGFSSILETLRAALFPSSHIVRSFILLSIV